MATKPIYQIYVELAGYRPAIWRRFLVRDDVSMATLSYVLMKMFEMDVSHLFCFDIPVVKNLKFRTGKITKDDNPEELRRFEQLTGKQNVRLEIPSEYGSDSMGRVTVLDSRDVTVADIFAKKGEKAVFSYDFGDGWELNIKIEKRLLETEVAEKKLPCIIAGEGFGIIEDCGGIWGLMDIAAAYEEGSGEEYDNYVEWLGEEELDLISFDIEDMNSRLQNLLKRSVSINKKG